MNDLDGFNDHDFLEYKFWTRKLIPQSVCLKSLWAKNDIFVIITAQLQQIDKNLPRIY